MDIPKSGLITGEDGQSRCFWHGNHADYLAYHDDEWGTPVHDDIRLFEKICLEGFQSGLSWLTILRKREGFRKAFAGFDFHKVAKFRESHVVKLLDNAAIVRHRKKIESTINNAQRAIELQKEFGSLGAYFWKYEPSPKARPTKLTWEVLKEHTTTAESTAMSKDLKKRGWSFIGPTTAYAFMQAMGMVNDHLEGCASRSKVEKARGKFKRPCL